MPTPTLATDALSSVSDVADAVSSFDPASLGQSMLAGLALGAGLTLLFSGARILRLGIILVAALAAAFAANAAAERVGLPAPIAWAAASAAVAALAAIVLYRFAIALALASILALAAPVAAIALDAPTASAADTTLVTHEEAASLDEIDTDHDADHDAEAGADSRSSAMSFVYGVRDRAVELARDAVEQGRAAWDNMPPARRTTVLAAAPLAAIVGLALGLLFPTLAAGLLTSAAGVAIILPAASILIDRHAPASIADRLPTEPITIGAVAAAATIIGAALQCASCGRRAPRPVTRPAPPPAADAKA